MELVDDEDVETIVNHCCPNWSHQTGPIQFFFELVDVEPIEDFTPLSEEHEVHSRDWSLMVKQWKSYTPTGTLPENLNSD
ncbi:hypothetical protein PVK06_023420 [Gossypium arboreum]|uniref:Uncharacterized protein n=1 Tax=Gossypium arboreum TaxID=29729 RepID=A0ABR0PB47_GOSAR|nr:hypothetical protein PVK06_023420 [Gossypium arboreum]